MDKELFRQSIKEVKKLRLSPDEKSAARQSVLNFISLNPLKPGISPNFSYRAKSAWFGFSLVPAMAVFLIVVISVGGGISLGAERALPGDILYPVKIKFNEEVRGFLSVSEESKVDWEVKRAERRLYEAEELAENGSLNLEAREKIESNFDAHAERVKDRIDKFESKENYKAVVDVSSKFEKSLKVHQEILDRLSEDTEEAIKNEVRPIRERVRQRAETLIKTKERVESRQNRTKNPQ